MFYRLDFSAAIPDDTAFFGDQRETRAGPPEPPSSLIGAAIRNAPDSGKSFQSPDFSS